MISGIAAAITDEVAGNGEMIFRLEDNGVDEASLEKILPNGPRELGAPDAECEEEGQPEVVGCDRRVSATLFSS